jgi:DNA invertase Pin-like site-specific DNA recombinase
MPAEPSGAGGLPKARALRAAQYLRMSTESQRYSLSSQRLRIAEYAAARGVEVVATYCDAGVSGLRLQGRLELQRLLQDVISGDAAFDLILIYDISRWGRFQDTDEAGHYEFMCRRSGVAVEYCAESFDNDGSLVATIAKSLRRGAAAEFSRDLSTKVRLAKTLIAKDGFWVGGTAGYGLRRCMLETDGSRGLVLEFGERKALQGRRVILVSGPPHEVRTVRWIYRLYLGEKLPCTAIHRRLNRENVPAEGGARWSANRVREVLQNEKYVGVNVLGRTRYDLGTRPQRQPRDTWLRVPGAFEPIVSRRVFDAARERLRFLPLDPSEEDLLANLKRLLVRKGRLTATLIDDAADVHSTYVYRKRFGSLITAYRRVGYEPTARQLDGCELTRRTPRRYNPRRRPPMSDTQILEGLGRLLKAEGRLSVQLINDDPELPDCHHIADRFGGMRRVYALVGYAPTRQQAWAMESRGGQSISADVAAEICRNVAGRRQIAVQPVPPGAGFTAPVRAPGPPEPSAL